MTAESMLSKRPVLGTTVAVFFLLKLFLSNTYCIPMQILCNVSISLFVQAVRTASFTLIGSIALFMGEKTRMLFESEKPAIVQQIDAEMEKVIHAMLSVASVECLTS